MTPDERRALIERPFPQVGSRDRVIGGKTHAGTYRISDRQEEESYRRYLRWLALQRASEGE